MIRLRWLVSGVAWLGAVACSGRIDLTTPVPPEAEAGASEPDAAGPIQEPTTRWELDVTAYGTDCATNWDCRLVAIGPCRDCMCHDTALNLAEVYRYQADFAAELVRTQCDPIATRSSCSERCAADGIAVCIDRHCAPATNQKMDLSAYDRACTTADDCIGVSGWLCFGHTCTDAIAKSAHAQFDADRLAAPACGIPGPYDASDCADSVRCKRGACELEQRPVP